MKTWLVYLVLLLVAAKVVEASPPRRSSYPSYPSNPSYPSWPSYPLSPSWPSYPDSPSYPSYSSYPSYPSYSSYPSHPSYSYFRGILERVWHMFDSESRENLPIEEKVPGKKAPSNGSRPAVEGEGGGANDAR